MSLILDAIKKSEQERNKSRDPETQSIHSSRAGGLQEKSVTSRIALLVLAIGIIGVGIWLLPAGQELLDKVASTSAEKPAVAATSSATESQSVAVEEPPPAQYYDKNDELPPGNQIQELWELPADFQSTIPDMEFSFHVFSREPSKRTIIINGRRMREGQLVSKNLTLKVITETGVIFHSRGRFFHVDVIEKW